MNPTSIPTSISALDRIIRAPRAGRVGRVDRSREPRVVVAARSDALSSRAARHRPGRRVRDLDERGRHRVRAPPRRLLPRRRRGRADRVHQRGRQPMAAGRARAGGDDRGDHPARPSRRHRLPGGRAARATRRRAPVTSSSASSTGGAPSPSSSPRLVERHGRFPMRLTLTQFVTLDGVYQGPGSPDEDPSDGFTRGGWMVPHMDQTFIAQAAAWLARGRRPAARPPHLRGVRRRRGPSITDPDDPFTERMNGLPKYVASHTLTDATWSPSTILRGDVVAQVAAAQGPAGTRAPAARLGPARADAAGRRPDRRGPPGRHAHRARTRTTALPDRRPGRRHARHRATARHLAASRSSCSKRRAGPSSPPTTASAPWTHQPRPADDRACGRISTHLMSCRAGFEGSQRVGNSSSGRKP